MIIGSCKSLYNRVNIVKKKKNNFRIIFKIIEMGIYSYCVLEEDTLCVCQFQSVIDDFREKIYLPFSCERNCLLCSVFVTVSF